MGLTDTYVFRHEKIASADKLRKMKLTVLVIVYQLTIVRKIT